MKGLTIGLGPHFMIRWGRMFQWLGVGWRPGIVEVNGFWCRMFALGPAALIYGEAKR